MANQFTQKCVRGLQFVTLLFVLLLPVKLLAQDLGDDERSTIVYKNPVLDALDLRTYQDETSDNSVVDNAVEKPTTKTERTSATTTSPNDKGALLVGSKKVSGSITTQNGFRVQIYNGTDKKLALKIKAEFNRRYLDMRSYLVYNAPNFKINVGDFPDKKSAQKFAKQIQAIIATAIVVPSEVTIKNIVVE
jgi:hypothetical protein